MADALAGLNATSPTAALSETQGARLELELSFTNADDSVCADTETPVESAVLFPARVTLDSAAGEVRGKFSIDVVNLLSAGRITASASALVDDPATMGDLPASFGIQAPMTFAGYGASSAAFQTGVTSDDSWARCARMGCSRRIVPRGTQVRRAMPVLRSCRPTRAQTQLRAPTTRALATPPAPHQRVLASPPIARCSGACTGVTQQTRTERQQLLARLGQPERARTHSVMLAPEQAANVSESGARPWPTRRNGRRSVAGQSRTSAGLPTR